MKVKCKLAGKRIIDIAGNPYTCSGCKGVLVKKRSQLRHENPVATMFSFPRKGIEYSESSERLLIELIGKDTFDCPATIPAFNDDGSLKPEIAKLVEVIEE